VPLNFITFGVMLVSISWRVAFGCGAAASLLAFAVAAAQFRSSKKEAWQPACRSQHFELRDAGQDAAAARLLEAGELSSSKWGNEPMNESFESTAALLGEVPTNDERRSPSKSDERVPTNAAHSGSWFSWDNIEASTTSALTRLQAMARGNAARKELAERHEMAKKLQAAQRGKAVRRRREEMVKAATKLQAVHRGHVIRKRSSRGWWPEDHPEYSPQGGNCPWGHPMDLQLAESGFCDRCERTLELGELVFECYECDFFLCGDCHSQEPPEPRHKPIAEATDRLEPVVVATEPPISTEPAVPVVEATEPPISTERAVPVVEATEPPISTERAVSFRKTCLKGHPLEAWVCDSIGACDSCAKPIENGETAMDCEACDYMLCNKCYYGGSEVPQVQQASAAAKMTPPSSSLRCPLGHPLQEFINDTSGECDGCSRAIQVGEVVMDCESCDYYLCKSCTSQQQR